MSDYFPRSGDIFLTRNPAGENPTPGLANHCAIVAAGRDMAIAVEIQVQFPEVVAFRLEDFGRRYPVLMAVRPDSGVRGRTAAAAAVRAVGSPIQYSLRPDQYGVGRDNCVSFVAKCYRWAGVETRWTIPDHVRTEVRSSEPFRPCYYRRSPDWTPPAEKWSGRVTADELLRLTDFTGDFIR